MKSMHLGVAGAALVALGVIAGAHPTAGQNVATNAAIETGQARVRAYMAEQHVPGLSVAVARDGHIEWSEGFGYSDLEHRVAVWPTTRFRIASISKTLTSVAVARLWEDGKLDLDAPVQRYAPTFPEKRFPITTRHLTGHLSGIPHYNREDFINTVRYESVTDALRKFEDRPLLFEPGERYSYSSFGWNLVSVVVEGASGESFLEHMQAEVFEPLGMRHTMADHYDLIIENRTEFYQVGEDGTVKNTPAVDNSDVWAGGGFLSTAEDLVRFGHGVLHGSLVGNDALELLLTPMETRTGESTGYGVGWRVWEVDGHRAAGHSGGHVGATTQLVALLDIDLVVAVLTNSNNRALSDLAEELLGLFLDE